MFSTNKKYDVVVLGGTPGGIAAAIGAARHGRTVALIERHAHLGGMSTSGLGKSDVEHREVIGGLFLEFVSRIRDKYIAKFGEDSPEFQLCREGYYFEPSVAEVVFDEMLAAFPTITVLRQHQLESANVEQQRVRAIQLLNRRTKANVDIEGEIFIDATYEGDLFAAAGAEFRLGREERSEFDEAHAGSIYFDYQNGAVLPGSSGEADDRLPAYTYRLCLTTDRENSAVMSEPPPGYDRQRYLPYLDDLEAGRLSAPKVLKDGWGYYPEHFDTLLRALSVTDLPNKKVDANINPRPLAFPFPEENVGYVEGDWRQRDEIAKRHRQLTIGLLWFLQHDEAVPAEHRAMAKKYHPPRDEFVDNGHFPWQLYVREARRLLGRYTLTEHDVSFTPDSPTTPDFDDTVALGEFPIDSFPVRKRQPQDDLVLEGYLGMLAHITRPYQIPYRVMLPQAIEGLIVPVAVSATHVAYSSVRMEPTWMALGHAAGLAAHLAIEHDVPLADVSMPDLQSQLTAEGQILEVATV
ncbi:FAD-dependent oxidoreductase [Blastopirellula sp. J2-11]|uniref:FAD-dependent oxidoreductase n=1 Tax=Blastopirellula sp. J2-11 TaxID=2943192 RepID=UPI0021C8FBD8|nr:FAD-dependent oxidoreductase [Blastopirellula sp. J2-11]UUO07747.1 FAD-dependent oxidoreductase [Blastopirellula sp. J2-11]